MGFQMWQIGTPDKQLAKELAEECGVDPFVALIASARGYTFPGELDEYLSDEALFEDSFDLPDMERAVETIGQALLNGEKIAVFGDYDCDGVTATALLMTYLTGQGADCMAYIPHRICEGYGMNAEAIRYLASCGVSLIITVDNGISCKEEIALAYELGMRVVVTDHHLPPAELPHAEAVVDPCLDPHGGASLCGAAVAFKLICALDGVQPEERLTPYGVLAALGTLGDVMPLTGENRCLVRLAIGILRERPPVGLAALCRVAGIKPTELDANRVAFGLIPRINAAGRMDNAMDAYALLTEKDPDRALELANKVHEANTLRQQTEKEIYVEALAQLEGRRQEHDRVLVVCGENWHGGVIGIVAARLCERYGRPAVVLSSDGTMAHGSARSIEGFSIYEAIAACRDCLVKYGGHAGAAGISLLPDRVGEFRTAINAYAATLPRCFPVLKLDCKLNPAALSLDLVEALDSLAPFGAGNERPLFGLFGVTLERITPMGGGKHLRLSCQKNGQAFQAVLFGTGEAGFGFCVGDTVDLAVWLDRNEYGGKIYVSVQIRGIRPTGIDQDAIADQLTKLDDCLAGLLADGSSLLPQRAECGTVYKYLCAHPCTLSGVVSRFAAAPGAAKAELIVTALCQCGLAETVERDGQTVYRGLSCDHKVDLTAAPVWQRLKGEVS